MIIKRSDKGSAITYLELDNNFNYLTVGLFDNYTTSGNVNAVETQLTSYVIPPNLFNNNGEKVKCEYGGSMVANANNILKLYLNEVLIYDSGTNGSVASDWYLDVTLIRASSSVLRYIVKVMDSDSISFANYISVGELTGLNLATTNTLKLSAISGATNNITCKMNSGIWLPRVL